MKVVACLGGGVDSTAMIFEGVKRGERIDLVLFADTGNEKPATYTHIFRFEEWLAQHGIEFVTVRRTYGKHTTLEERLLSMKDLPSRVYGRGTCAYDWKLYPMWAELKRRADEPWERWIGFNTDEDHRERHETDEKGHRMRYPLIEWGMDRAAARAAIVAAGFDVPVKSACFFCPASKPAEVTALRDESPDLFARALKIEDGAIASGTLRDVVGLGRNWRWRSVAGQGVLGFDPPEVPDCGVCIT